MQGVGKTYSVSQVCRDLHVELFLLDGASIFGSGAGVAGAAEEMMRSKFAEARGCGKPAVLFIDEIVSKHARSPRSPAKLVGRSTDVSFFPLSSCVCVVRMCCVRSAPSERS